MQCGRVLPVDTQGNGIGGCGLNGPGYQLPAKLSTQAFAASRRRNNNSTKMDCTILHHKVLPKTPRLGARIEQAIALTVRYGQQPVQLDRSKRKRHQWPSPPNASLGIRNPRGNDQVVVGLRIAQGGGQGAGLGGMGGGIVGGV